MSVDFPADFPRAPRLMPTREFAYGPAGAPLKAGSAASSRTGSPRRAPPQPATGNYGPFPPRYRSSSTASNMSTGSDRGLLPAPLVMSSAPVGASSTRSSRRSSTIGRFPVKVDGGDGTPPSRRMSRNFYSHSSSPAPRSRSRAPTVSSLSSTPPTITAQPILSQTQAIVAPIAQTSSIFQAWPLLHTSIIPHLTPRDLMELRLVSKGFHSTVSPRLFEHLHITFSRTVLRPNRIFTLKHVGHHVRTVSFQIPHSADMILPPLFDSKAGTVVDFKYDPDVSHASLGMVSSGLEKCRYGSPEMTDLLIERYPPLFHVATNIPAFIDLLSALPEIAHLIISCPGQKAGERLKMSIVDYALISLRIAVEQARLPRLARLSVNRIHAAGLRHLHPLHGAGCTDSAVSRWSQLRTLDMIVDALPVYHSPPYVRGIQADVDSLLMVRDFIAYFAPVVERLGFAWAGGRGPDVLTLGRNNVSVTDSGVIAAPLMPAMAPISKQPSKATKTSSGLFGRKRFPVISRPEAVGVSSNMAAAPVAQMTASADVLPLPQLTDLRLAQVVDSARNLSALIQAHSTSLRGFSLEDVNLTSGSWIDVLDPLTSISGAADWKVQVESALAGMDSACGVRVRIVGGGDSKHVMVMLLADGAGVTPGHSRAASGDPESVSSSAASARSVFSAGSRRSSVVGSSAASCHSVAPMKSSSLAVPGPLQGSLSQSASVPSLLSSFPPAPTHSPSLNGRPQRPASFVSAPTVARFTRPARSTTISTHSPTLYGPFPKTPMITIAEARTPTSPEVASQLPAQFPAPFPPRPEPAAQTKDVKERDVRGRAPSRPPPPAASSWSRSRSTSTASVVSTNSGAITISVRGSRSGSVVEAARPVIAELASTLPPVEGPHPMLRLADNSDAIEKPTSRQIEQAIRVANELRRSQVASIGYAGSAISASDFEDAHGDTTIKGDTTVLEATNDSMFHDMNESTIHANESTIYANESTIHANESTIYLNESTIIGESTFVPRRMSVSPYPPLGQAYISASNPPPTSGRARASSAASASVPFVKRGLRHISSLVRLRKEPAPSQTQPFPEIVRVTPTELCLRQLALVDRPTASQPTSRPCSPRVFARPARHSMAGPTPSRKSSVRSEVPSIMEEEELSPIDEANASILGPRLDFPAQAVPLHDLSEVSVESELERPNWPLPPPTSPVPEEAEEMETCIEAQPESRPESDMPSRPESDATSDLRVLTRPSTATSMSDDGKPFVPNTPVEQNWMAEYAASPADSPNVAAFMDRTGGEVESYSSNSSSTRVSMKQSSPLPPLPVEEARPQQFPGPVPIMPGQTFGRQRQPLGQMANVNARQPSRVHRALTRAKSAFGLNAERTVSRAGR